MTMRTKVSLQTLLALLLLSGIAAAMPIRLTRHPDYHAGKIAFSYLGDIWVADEDGSNVHRLTDNTARDVYPRFSPDGRWIAFLSNRYGNYDVFVIASSGGAARRFTYHTGNDEVVGWTRDSRNVTFRSSRGDGVFPSVATLYQVSIEGGPETALPVDWGYWNSYSPDGKRFVFNRHPLSGRGSTIAAATPPTFGLPTWRRRLTQNCSETKNTIATGRCGARIMRSISSPTRVGTIYKTGPADHEYMKIHRGDYILSIDDHELKTADNYWKYLTLAAGRKFHFLLNSKPMKEGSWELTVEPVSNSTFGNLQYVRWAEDRRSVVDKLSNGEIGYLHIKAMDTPSLRQFELDLAANRTKKALIIDQRFNGGGGIDQELLAILSGRKYQYAMSRDSDIKMWRPQNFYGPMVVMQNERSASDAEMFPQGFKDLGLGKVIGVPTMSAVIGTGSYSLLDGSIIRTPGSGVWTVNGENMENYGVSPDIYVDNTPNDFVKGRDAQIEKAVEVLKTEMAAAAKRR